jgi:hypothetical protein
MAVICVVEGRRGRQPQRERRSVMVGTLREGLGQACLLYVNA